MKLVALVCEKCSGDLEWEQSIPEIIRTEGLTQSDIAHVTEVLERAMHENVVPILDTPKFEIIEPKYRMLRCKSCERMYLLADGALE